MLSRHTKFKLFLSTVVAGFCLLLLELTAYIIIVVNGSNFYLPLELNDLGMDSLRTKKQSMFDAKLGWEPVHPNHHGYRGEEKDSDAAVLALFGDSFTEGYPVIEKSWPHLLERKLGKPVLNFGVGGYGTDQALLRFETRYLDNIDTPYVALLVMSENIARVVNRYRGFYKRKRNISLAKPMFHKQPDGKIELLPNPVQSVEEVLKLSDMTFLKEIGMADYWYHHYERLGLNQFVGFPYSYYLVKALPYYIARGYRNRFRNRREYDQLYENREAVEVLEYILVRFVQEVEHAGSVPLIVFLPNWKDMIDFQQTGSTIYRDFFSAFKEKRYALTYDGLDYFRGQLEQGVAVSRYFRSRLEGHYNPEGEQVLSDGFYKTLVSVDLENSRVIE